MVPPLKTIVTECVGMSLAFRPSVADGHCIAGEAVACTARGPTVVGTGAALTFRRAASCVAIRVAIGTVWRGEGGTVKKQNESPSAANPTPRQGQSNAILCGSHVCIKNDNDILSSSILEFVNHTSEHGTTADWEFAVTLPWCTNM
eukprot:m.567508 g.567508  ORF g.567508 m.567508 type:complete len:146 (-) comp22255_c0_seq25:92-529(-)